MKLSSIFVIFGTVVFSILISFLLALVVNDERDKNKQLQLDNNLMVSQLYDCNNKLSDYDKLILEKNTEIEKWIYLYNEVVLTSNNYEAQFWDLSKRYDDLCTDYSTLMGEYNNSQVALETVTEEKAELQTQVEDLQNQIDELSVDLENNQTQITDLQNQVIEKNTLIAEKDLLIEEMQAELSRLFDQMLNVENDKSSLNITLQEKEQQIAELEQEQTRLQTHVQALTSERDNLYIQRDNYQTMYNDLLNQLAEYGQYAVLVDDSYIIELVEVDDTKTQTCYTLSSKEQLSTILFYSWQNLRIVFVSNVRVAVDGVEVDVYSTLEINGCDRAGSSIVIKNISNVGVLDFSRVRVNASFNCSTNSSYSFNDTLTIINDNGVYTVYEEGSQQYCPVTNVDTTNGIITYEVQKKVSMMTVSVPCTLDFVNMTTSAKASAIMTTVNWSGYLNLLDKLY